MFFRFIENGFWFSVNKVRKKSFNQSLKTSKVIPFPSKTTYFKVLYRITTERSSSINPPAQKLKIYHHPI